MTADPFDGKNPTGLTAKQLLFLATFDDIYDNHPYLSGIVCQWDVIETDTVKTAATNGPQMFYNAEFLESLTRGEAAWLMLHEAGHVFLGHQSDSWITRKKSGILVFGM